MTCPACRATWELVEKLPDGVSETDVDRRELRALGEWVERAEEDGNDKKLVAFRDRLEHQEELIRKETEKPLDQRIPVRQFLQERARKVLSGSYNEVKNLLWIERNPVHKKALEDWERKGQLLTAKIERKKKRSSDLRNEVYQLIGFFCVFQGVVLTAVAQSSLLHCNNFWCPLALSVLASIVTLFGVRQKLDLISDLDVTILTEEASLREVVARESNLRRLGEEFEFFIHCEDTAASHGGLPTGLLRKEETCLRNLTHVEILLQEGNSNTYRSLATVGIGMEYVIKVDPNATYRDYVILTMPRRCQLKDSISTDDCHEHSEIIVEPSDNGTYALKKVPRNARGEKSLFQKIKDMFSALFVPKPQPAQTSHRGAQTVGGALNHGEPLDNAGPRNDAGAPTDAGTQQDAGALPTAIAEAVEGGARTLL